MWWTSAILMAILPMVFCLPEPPTYNYQRSSPLQGTSSIVPTYIPGVQDHVNNGGVSDGRYLSQAENHIPNHVFVHLVPPSLGQISAQPIIIPSINTPSQRSLPVVPVQDSKIIVLVNHPEISQHLASQSAAYENQVYPGHYAEPLASNPHYLPSNPHNLHAYPGITGHQVYPGNQIYQTNQVYSGQYVEPIHSRKVSEETIQGRTTYAAPLQPSSSQVGLNHVGNLNAINQQSFVNENSRLASASTTGYSGFKEQPLQTEVHKEIGQQEFSNEHSIVPHERIINYDPSLKQESAQTHLVHGPTVNTGINQRIPSEEHISQTQEIVPHTKPIQGRFYAIPSQRRLVQARPIPTRINEASDVKTAYERSDQRLTYRVDTNKQSTQEGNKRTYLPEQTFHNRAVQDETVFKGSSQRLSLQKIPAPNQGKSLQVEPLNTRTVPQTQAQEGFSQNPGFSDRQGFIYRELPQGANVPRQRFRGRNVQRDSSQPTRTYIRSTKEESVQGAVGEEPRPKVKDEKTDETTKTTTKIDDTKSSGPDM